MLSIKSDYCHGEIKILDSAGREVASGTGVFISKDKKFVARIEVGSDSKILRFETGWRIVLIEYKTGNVIVPTGSFLNKEMMTSFSNEIDLNISVESVTIFKDFDTAIEIITKGVGALSIILAGQGEKTTVFMPPTKINRFGSQQITMKVQPKDIEGWRDEKFEFRLFAGYKSERNKEIQNTLQIAITLKRTIQLRDINRVYEGLELYWSLYKSDTVFEPIEFSIDTKNGNSKIDCELTKRFDKPENNTLYVPEPKISFETFSKVLSAYISDDKHNKKFAIGLHRFLKTSKKKKDTCESFIFGYATTLDIITGYIAREVSCSKSDVARCKENIVCIQNQIEKMPNLETKVKEFYCNKEVDAIYQSMSVRPVAQNFETVCADLKLKLDEKEEEAIKKIIKIRHAMMHGDGYDLEAELERLLGGTRIWHETSDDGSESYSIGYDEGWIFLTREVLEKMLKAYFETL